MGPARAVTVGPSEVDTITSDISVLDDGPWRWPNAVCTPVPRRPLSGVSGMRAQARDLAAREAGHQPVAPRPGHRSPPDTDQSDRAGQARHHHRHRTAPVKGARGRRPVLDQNPEPTTTWRSSATCTPTTWARSPPWSRAELGNVRPHGRPGASRTRVCAVQHGCVDHHYDL
jgi:hypothetical protein